jgi:hypothetical protein
MERPRVCEKDVALAVESLMKFAPSAGGKDLGEESLLRASGFETIDIDRSRR